MNSLSLHIKTTHMWRRWGTLQNFLLAFIDELLKNLKKQNFEKMKKKVLEISSFYTCVLKTTIIWGKVPEIWSETEFFCHFGSFFALFPPSPNNPENQNFEKMRKASGDIIILRLCNKKHDHMMYAYSDMDCDRHNFFSF